MSCYDCQAFIDIHILNNLAKFRGNTPNVQLQAKKIKLLVFSSQKLILSRAKQILCLLMLSETIRRWNTKLFFATFLINLLAKLINFEVLPHKGKFCKNYFKYTSEIFHLKSLLHVILRGRKPEQ